MQNAIGVSVANAQQTKEKESRGDVPKTAPQPSPNVISDSKVNEKLVKDKGPPPALSNRITSDVQQRMAKNIKFSIEHDDGPERDQQMAIDQGGRNMSSSTYTIDGRRYPLVRSLYEIENKTTTPNCSGERFGKFQFDVIDILDPLSR